MMTAQEAYRIGFEEGVRQGVEKVWTSTITFLMNEGKSKGIAKSEVKNEFLEMFGSDLESFAFADRMLITYPN